MDMIYFARRLKTLAKTILVLMDGKGIQGDIRLDALDAVAVELHAIATTISQQTTEVRAQNEHLEKVREVIKGNGHH